jgi:hypothetical protein
MTNHFAKGSTVSPDRFAFVLRLWNEAASGRAKEQLAMRGSLQLSSSDEIVYFNSLGQLPGLLQEITGWMDASGEEHPVSD